MAEKKKAPVPDPLGFKQAGKTIKSVTDPFSKVMGWMDKAGRWAFGESKNDKRKKRLEQAGQGKGGK